VSVVKRDEYYHNRQLTLRVESNHDHAYV
jgi:hypothetical protein